MSINIIPPMTHPNGRHWRQPDVTRILIDDDCAMMDSSTFERLSEYSSSRPTGVYPGKCWRANWRGEWYLCWYGADDGHPDGLITPCRKIVLIDETPIEPATTLNKFVYTTFGD